MEVGCKEVICVLFDDKAKIDIPCMECGSKKKFSIGELKGNPSFVCEKCGTKNTIESSKFVKGLDDAEKKLASVFKKFR